LEHVSVFTHRPCSWKQTNFVIPFETHIGDWGHIEWLFWPPFIETSIKKLGEHIGDKSISAG
jgi:hypothetical protein